MKKVLIIGENSYIGESFANFAKDKYKISIVSSLNESWKNISFKGYDSILHCAGIAHTDLKHNEETKKLYYTVNCDLAVAVAEKARAEGVNQFLFMSSMLVYGSMYTEIDLRTSPNPENYYAKSKLRAELELHKFSDEKFKLCIIRPPMVYGPGCKGNFPRLAGLARKTPIFPDFPNKRSMIYIDNLCNFFCKLIDLKKSGLFLPQNSEYVNTTMLVQRIAEFSGRKIITTRLFNPVIRLFVKDTTGSDAKRSGAKISGVNSNETRSGKKTGPSTLQKVFGSLTYSFTGNEDSYNIVGFDESVKISLAASNGNPRLYEEKVNQRFINDEAIHIPVIESKESRRTVPLLSIITVTLNSENTLQRAIESVLNQTIPPSEYFIIDGASSDNTVKLAESYRKAFIEKGINYYIISEPDMGTYDAMNKGIQKASGDIIGMINSDDWYEPEAVESAIDTYNNTGYDMMFADLRIYPGDLKSKPFIKKAKLGKWVHSRNWNHPTTFAKRSIYIKSPFPLESIYDDFDLYIKLRKEKKKIVILNKVLANYRLGGMSNERGFKNALDRVRTRYRIYRKNRYSRIYLFECLIIEGAKFILT